MAKGWINITVEIPNIWKQKLQRNADKFYEGDMDMEIRYHLRKFLDV